MTEQQITCIECGNVILQSTALARGGLCAPCHQRAATVRVELSMRDEQVLRAIDVIRTRLRDGCSDEEFNRMACPVCGSGLSLSVAPTLQAFHVRCPQDSTHVSFHEGVMSVPEWWQAHVKGWYS